MTGIGSIFSAGSVRVGLSGATGSLTFSSGSTGTFTAINVDTSPVREPVATSPFKAARR